ncbi:MAG: hypothetical protein ABSH04_06135, partial [Acidimicrobiales bacterium]
MTLSSRRFRAGAQRSPAAFAGLVALAVLAGCGSSAASSGSTTTATTSAADGNHTVLSARDKELARHSLIRLSDFPAGWTEQGRITEGNSSSGLPNAQAAHLTSCLRVPVSDIDTRVPRWTSPTFSDDSDAARVDDDVTVYSNAAKAAADYSTFSDPRTPNCVVNVLGGPLKQQIAQQLQSGQSIGQVGAG